MKMKLQSPQEFKLNESRDKSLDDLRNSSKLSNLVDSYDQGKEKCSRFFISSTFKIDNLGKDIIEEDGIDYDVTSYVAYSDKENKENKYYFQTAIRRPGKYDGFNIGKY